MRDRRILTHADCINACARLVKDLAITASTPIYGIPRGGIPVAYIVGGLVTSNCLLENPEEAMVLLDDVIDSGTTRTWWSEGKFPGVQFAALADYLDPPRRKEEWLVFPWEQDETGDASADDIVIRLLEYIGEDPTRGGLKDTPRRVLAAWKEWTSGYGKDPGEILKAFEDGAEGYNQMVMVKDFPFYSHCEHHLTNFFGTATIAYIPDKRVVGLSKLGRVLDIYAKRLQVQERLTNLVADAIQDNLKPKGVGVLIRARHLCMEGRGLAKQGHETITSALRGEFMSDAKVRQEFLSLAYAR